MEPFFRKNVGFQSHLTLFPHEQIELNFQLDRLIKEFEQKELGYRFLIQTKLMEIFIYLSRRYERMLRKPMTTLANEQEVIERVCEFIDLHHAKPLTLRQMSQLCGMSQSTFTNKFKEYSGYTFLKYRDNIRIKVAKDLLAMNFVKITNIARLSPSEYRKKIMPS